MGGATGGVVSAVAGLAGCGAPLGLPLPLGDGAPGGFFTMPDELGRAPKGALAGGALSAGFAWPPILLPEAPSLLAEAPSLLAEAPSLLAEAPLPAVVPVLPSAAPLPGAGGLPSLLVEGLEEAAGEPGLRACPPPTSVPEAPEFVCEALAPLSAALRWPRLGPGGCGAGLAGLRAALPCSSSNGAKENSSS